jgi:antitoxin component YwqK of YwqJK toxin-antitoxin module
MLRLIIFFLTIVIISGCEKTIDSQELEWKNGIFYKINDSKPYSGKMITYWKNGNVSREGELKEGKYHGEHKLFYKSGNIDEVITYKDGEGHGKHEVWYENGNKRLETTKIKGHINDGKYKSWYENGQLFVDGIYKDNKLVSSVSKVYDEDGNSVDSNSLEYLVMEIQWMQSNQSEEYLNLIESMKEVNPVFK